jgi:hypothetical protein
MQFDWKRKVAQQWEQQFLYLDTMEIFASNEIQRRDISKMKKKV